MTAQRPVSVFVSYAQEDPGHVAQVDEFCAFLRDQGIRTRYDMHAARQPRDWSIWMLHQLEECDFVLVIGSAAYRRRAEDREHPGAGHGVRWEARLIRDLVYAATDSGLSKVLSVVLPGGSVEGIPGWLQPHVRTHYAVGDLTPAGAAPLLDYLLGRHGPPEPHPAAGPRPGAPPRHPGPDPAPPWPLSVGGDYVAGDKHGDTIVNDGKHVHNYPHHDTGTGT